MAVTIKVAVRCRPYTIDDALGVHMVQNSDEDGEINLINSTYTNNRFAFTWSWWTAFGWQRHIVPREGPDADLADSMKFTGQQDAYEAVGHKIKADVLDGNAVVLFAYGLSGSGKTFTVFGPDAADIPEAWFKHPEPHDMWGLFPRLAYELFQMKEDGWKFKMKYFQNVVDTVRDLMSPVGKEEIYKAGMKKDADGFMDIKWCQETVLQSWDELRSTFLECNARKAIAPTQFNQQSTRGHCIMTLEVEKPHPEREGMKQRGRIYVCDLAGTEPAGDIFYAKYQKITFDDGTVEHKLLGPHPDQKKSKELQDQGKKINLSLTEMAQFFMKMAEAIKKKKLKPGKGIPGCNSYFLCKYLKDTMLQARTYLFCAIRPEVKYLAYTYSTLGFAKNASVVKLQPKKAQANMSPMEKKLMAELEEMKALVKQLQESGGGGGDNSELEAVLAQKQAELAAALAGGGGGGGDDQEAQLQQQKEEYAAKGISMVHFEKDTEFPYLVNLDEDEFRSRRFMYIFSEDNMVFGKGANFQPLSLMLVRNHCTVEKTEDAVTIVGGEGEVFRNGAMVNSGERVTLESFDRIVIAGELCMFHWPGKDPEDGDPMNGEAAVEEYQQGMRQARMMGGGGGGDDEAHKQFMEQMRKFEEEKKKFEEEKANAIASGQSVAEIEAKHAEELAMQAVDAEILDMLPKIRELTNFCQMLDRGMLEFEVSLQKPEKADVPKVKVKVTNNQSSETIFLDTFEFMRAYSTLTDEMKFMSMAFANSREYELQEEHDPVTILFDNSFQIGTASMFLEYLVYNLETEDEDRTRDVKRAVIPYDNCARLECSWTPLAGPEEEDQDKELLEILDPDELVGKSWTYRFQIKGVVGLPLVTDLAYCQYEFFGELFTTESVEQNTSNPVFDYSFVHHVENATQEFVDYLSTHTFEVQVFVNPFVQPPGVVCGTANASIKENFDAGEPVASSFSGQSVTGKPAGGGLRAQVDALNAEKAAWTEREKELLKRIEELEAENTALKGGEGQSSTAAKIEEAQKIDAEVNG